MKATELRYFDNFFVTNTDEQSQKLIDDVDRRYPTHAKDPWMVCSGATLDAFIIVRDGVHLVISAENTEVKLANNENKNTKDDT